MIAHPWRLGADVTALENGALQWGRVAADLTATADDLVGAARQALDAGWESEAAESFELQRRMIVQQIDTFTTVADRISSSLTALADLLRTAQEELDRSWLSVSSVPYELVGAEGVLVLQPTNAADEELVRGATEAARGIRRRLQDQLDAEATRLRESRMELVTVRYDLVQASGGSWAVTGADGVYGASGGAVVLPSGSVAQLGGQDPDERAGSATSIAGTAAGAAGGAVSAAPPALPALPALPAIGPIAVSMPALTGLSAAALAAGAGVAGLGAAAARGGARREEAPAAGTGMAPMGGMAAGAAMRGGGTLGRPGAGGQGSRGATPSLAGQESPEDRAARLEREKEAAREAKRRLIAERQAERAARRAQRAGAEAERPRPVIEVSEVAPGDEQRPSRG